MRTTYERAGDEGGFSFAFAMGVILIFLVIGAALLTLVVNESNMVVRHSDSRRAYYVAEAGINHALFELNQSPAGDGVTSGTVTVGSQTGSYTTTYSENILTATATFPSSGSLTKTISVKVNPAVAAGSWNNTGAIAAAKIENIFSEMTVWNGPGDTDPDRLTLYSEDGININGYVLNYNQPVAGSEYLGWVYSAGSVGPGSNVGVNFRVAASGSSQIFPTFVSTTYDNMIDDVGDTGTALGSTISGTQTYGPGIYYREGDLTISGATIQTTAAVTRDNPVYIVVEDDLTIRESTIGVTNPTNLADPSEPPGVLNPYGNWIRILGGDDLTVRGTSSAPTYLNKEVRVYNQDDALMYGFVNVDRSGLYVGDKGDIETRDGERTWTTQTSGTSNRLYSVDFPDSSNGIAVGSSGTVRYTTNGGSSWSGASTSIGVTLRAVSFPDTGNAWAVGDSGNIWKSTNGGSTWSQQSSSGSQLNGVSFADSNYGVAVGEDAAVKYTTNGGSTWQNATSTPSGTPDLNGVILIQSGASYVGWAVGSAEGSPSRGTIWYTSDGGQTWSAQTTSSNQDLHGVTMVDGSNGWIAGDSGDVLRTTDGGTSWTAQTASNYGGTASSISAYDTYQGLMVGEYANSANALHTTNGGYVWDKMSVPSTNDLYGTCFVDKTNGWAVGESGIIMKYSGPSIYLRGTILTLDRIRFQLESDGGEVFIEGAIAGGVSGNVDAEIDWGDTNHLLDVMFSVGAMPGSTDDGIGGSMSSTGATLDYSTWRES